MSTEIQKVDVMHEHQRCGTVICYLHVFYKTRQAARRFRDKVVFTLMFLTVVPLSFILFNFFPFFLKKKRDLFTSYIIGGTSNLRDHLFTEYCSTFPFLLFLSVKREPSSPQESL